MNKMQLVIEIDEDLYERWINPSSPVWMRDTQVVYEALKKSTPLPKGHGDLIDKSELLKCKRRFEDFDGDVFYIIHEEAVINTPVIIKG